MKAAEVRALTDEQLLVTLREKEKNLFHLRFQSATDRLETPSEIRKERRDIARIMTIMHERKLQALREAAATTDAAAQPAGAEG